jgi:hypothetical protein
MVTWITVDCAFLRRKSSIFAFLPHQEQLLGSYLLKACNPKYFQEKRQIIFRDGPGKPGSSDRRLNARGRGYLDFPPSVNHGGHA